MTNQMAIRLVRSPESMDVSEGDPFFDLAQELNELIERRAYELFELSGSVHGRDRENWLQAQSELLLDAPVEVSETENGFTILADVPGCSENDLEVRVSPTSLCIAGSRPQPAEQREEKIVYTERISNRIFRLLTLPSEINTEKVFASVANGVLQVQLLKAGFGKKVPVLAKAVGA